MSFPSASLWPLRLTFTALRAKAEVVALTSVAVLAGDAGLALALPRSDVTLPVGGAQSVAVAPGGGRHTPHVTQKGHVGQRASLENTAQRLHLPKVAFFSVQMQQTRH